MSSFAIPFRLTWSIELFNKGILKGDRPLESPFFRIGSLRSTRWNVQLFRERTSSEDRIICDFKNGCGFHERETVYLDYSLYIKAGGERYFERSGSFTKYGPGCNLRVPFMHTRNLNHEHYPNGTLVVVCEMAPYQVVDPFCEAEHLKSLSRDTAVLHINKLYSDLTLFTDDRQMFEVHRFVIYSRWREAGSLLGPPGNESNVSGVPGYVFARFLRYLYTGKLSSRSVSPELFEFASQNCEELRNNIRSLSNALSVRTRFNTQHRVLKFRLTSWKSLSRVVHLTGFSPPELQINMDPVKRAGEEYLDISFWFAFQLDRPIHLRCRVLLVEGTESGSVLSATEQHVFATGKEWCFPPFIRKSDFDRLLGLQLVLALDIGDRLLPPTVENSLTAFRTGSYGVYDLHSLSRDFQRASKETTYKDVIVETGKMFFLRHKAMLSARSSLFRNLLERNAFLGGIQIIDISPLDYVPVMHVLEYIYSGSISHLTREEIIRLRYFAQLFRMHKLEESCCIFLASN